MNITSEDEALLELFENGKTSDKKYKRFLRHHQIFESFFVLK